MKNLTDFRKTVETGMDPRLIMKERKKKTTTTTVKSLFFIKNG